LLQGAGRGGARGEAQQHPESFLQLSLSALAALVAHECCRAQVCAKEPYMSPKEPYMSPKEPYMSPKEPYMSPKEPYVTPK